MGAATAGQSQTIASRLGAAAERLKSEDVTRRWYRLSLVLAPFGAEDPRKCPFSAVVVTTRARDGMPSRPVGFAERTEAVMPDPRDPKFKTKRVERPYGSARLTQAELDGVMERIPDYIVRWRAGRTSAEYLDATIPSVKATLDPTSDEPLEPYLKVEGPFDERP
jgi:hypothetical protein